MARRGKNESVESESKTLLLPLVFQRARDGVCCRTISSTAAMRALDHEEEEGHEEEATLSIEARATKGPPGIEPKPGGPPAGESAPGLITVQPSPLASPKCLPPPEHTVRPASLSGSPPCPAAPSPPSLARPLYPSLSRIRDQEEEESLCITEQDKTPRRAWWSEAD